MGRTKGILPDNIYSVSYQFQSKGIEHINTTLILNRLKYAEEKKFEFFSILTKIHMYWRKKKSYGMVKV